jgi:hypothetical protein
MYVGESPPWLGRSAGALVAGAAVLQPASCAAGARRGGCLTFGDAARRYGVVPRWLGGDDTLPPAANGAAMQHARPALIASLYSGRSTRARARSDPRGHGASDARVELGPRRRDAGGDARRWPTCAGRSRCAADRRAARARRPAISQGGIIATARPAGGRLPAARLPRVPGLPLCALPSRGSARALTRTSTDPTAHHPRSSCTPTAPAAELRRTGPALRPQAAAPGWPRT